MWGEATEEPAVDVGGGCSGLRRMTAREIGQPHRPALIRCAHAVDGAVEDGRESRIHAGTAAILQPRHTQARPCAHPEDLDSLMATLARFCGPAPGRGGGEAIRRGGEE